MFRQFGWPELVIILAIVMLLFGATRLPQVSRSLGASVRSFRRGFTGEGDGEEESKESESDKAATKKPEG